MTVSGFCHSVVNRVVSMFRGTFRLQLQGEKTGTGGQMVPQKLRCKPIILDGGKHHKPIIWNNGLKYINEAGYFPL
jgi:hypothetical protein